MKTLDALKNTLGTQARTEKSIIKKAQEFTGLKTEGVKTLIKEVRRIKTKERKAQQLKEAKELNLSRKQYLQWQSKAKLILDSFSTGYSMGDTKVIQINGKTLFRTDNHDQYSGKYKGSETYGFISINLSKKDFQNIENIDGIWTIREQNNKVKWLVETGSKQYHKLKWEQGFLVGTSHAKTLREAQMLQSRKEKTAVMKYDDKEFIGVSVIENLGACEAGINAFCKENGLNKDFGYTLGYLKSLNGAGTRYFSRISK